MSPSPDHADDVYAAIESTVTQTARGRWFLAEYARRRLAEDIGRILQAIGRLEARTARYDAERSRHDVEAERAADILRQLGEVLKDLRPLADARVRTKTLASRAPDEAAPTQALERRFAALVKLDGQDLEAGFKLSG